MPHRALARAVVDAALRGERLVGRLNPAAAAWMRRHRDWVYRPLHLGAAFTMLWWGLQLWFLLPDSAFDAPNYRVLRYFPLDAEGAAMVLLAALLFASPRWWLGLPAGRAFPLLPQVAMVLAGAAMVTISTTVSASSLLSGSGALAGGYVGWGLLVVWQAGEDASWVARETVRREQSTPAAEVRHAASV